MRLLNLMSISIPYFGGVIFAKECSIYYQIRKCNIIDDTTLNMCSFITINHVLLLNIVGILWVALAIILLKYKNIHRLGFIQINLMFICFYCFLLGEYINQGFIIILVTSVFTFTYLILVKSIFNINIINLIIFIVFSLSMIYPFVRGFKDFIYYYSEDKWINFNDYPIHNTGKEVWSKDIQTLLIGLNELKIKNFSSIEIGDRTFINSAAWPIKHIKHQKNGWMAHRKNTILNSKCINKWKLNGIYFSYC